MTTTRKRSPICGECGLRIVEARNTATGWSHKDTEAGRANEAHHPAYRWHDPRREATR